MLWSTSAVTFSRPVSSISYAQRYVPILGYHEVMVEHLTFQSNPAVLIQDPYGLIAPYERLPTA